MMRRSALSKNMSSSTLPFSTMFYLFVCLGWLSAVVSGTNIGTFTDNSCSRSFGNRNGPNGYPDGTCTRLSLGTSKSFSVVDLDPGCAVTIYGPDDDPALPCSSTLKVVAQHTRCYNSSWVYYSIDGCDIPSETPSPTPIITADSSPPPTGIASSPSSSPTSSVNATPRSSHTGVIIGGIVGGVALLALILFGVAFYYRKRHRPSAKRLPPPPPPPPSYELSNGAMIIELQYPEKTVQTEMWAHESAQEIGRNSTYEPPVELPGDTQPVADKSRAEKEAMMRNMI